MIVIDASVWVSYLVSADVNHPATRTWLDPYLAEGGILVSPITLLSEVAGAVARRSGDPGLAIQVTTSLAQLPSLRFLPIDSRLGPLAASLAATLRLRGADALYVATALELGIPLVTWDNEQLQRSAQAISVSLPSSLVQ